MARCSRGSAAIRKSVAVPPTCTALPSCRSTDTHSDSSKHHCWCLGDQITTSLPLLPLLPSLLPLLEGFIYAPTVLIITSDCGANSAADADVDTAARLLAPWGLRVSGPTYPRAAAPSKPRWSGACSSSLQNATRTGSTPCCQSSKAPSGTSTTACRSTRRTQQQSRA